MKTTAFLFSLLLFKGAVNAYFLTDLFSKKTVVFEAAIFVGQSEDGAEVRCEDSRRGAGSLEIQRAVCLAFLLSP
jgi:hypothetical protein